MLIGFFGVLFKVISCQNINAELQLVKAGHKKRKALMIFLDGMGKNTSHVV